MQTLTPQTITRPATVKDAGLIHKVYSQTPEYFKIISIPVPTLAEVERELEAAASDPRRCTELVLARDPLCQRRGLRDNDGCQWVIGYLDYKLDYPEASDATVNLLLILAGLQSRSYGRRCIRDLESRLSGRAKRILASIYGQNPRAERFWSSLGYSFAIDAKPLLDWYAKTL
ncbi:MAG: GNAT family N-acetyltransferase [Deinococcota bacterium]|nr:GNAT family N-acetyltransferase [Deinococcota bacterium]